LQVDGLLAFILEGGSKLAGPVTHSAAAQHTGSMAAIARGMFGQAHTASLPDTADEETLTNANT